MIERELPPKVESPAYVAEIVRVPTGSDEVENVATPPPSVPTPKTVAPFSKVTVSASGGGPALEVTVALKVTAVPAAASLKDETSAIDVAIFCTFSMTDPVLAASVASPV